MFYFGSNLKGWVTPFFNFIENQQSMYTFFPILVIFIKKIKFIKCASILLAKQINLSALVHIAVK